MNLNLDDRLCSNAVETMEAALDAGADLVGGDWKVCYSQEDTDATGATYSANTLPFDPTWPPKKGTLTRLGSGIAGTKHRGTYGPATAWKYNLHKRIGSYPNVFADGSLITIIGDGLWWQLIQRTPDTVTRRLPQVLGHYHSAPASQAEFRTDIRCEYEKAESLGIQTFKTT